MKKITIKEILLIACIIVGAIVSAIGFCSEKTGLGVLAAFFAALAALIEVMLHREEKIKETEAKERERKIQEEIAQRNQDMALKQENVLIDMDDTRRNTEVIKQDTGEILEYMKNNQNAQKLIALQEEQIERLKKQLAGKDLPDYKETAKPYVEERNFGKAIESIDTEKILNVAKKAKEDLERAADQLIFKAQLYIANFQFPEAEAHYKQAADIFPSYDNNFTVASFFQDLNRFKEAEDYYTRCLNQATSPKDRADVLNNSGMVQGNLNDYAQAEASFTEALKIYRELAATDQQAYLPHVAMTLNNLGEIYRLRNEYPQAEAFFTRALKTYRDLAAKNPQAYLPGVAGTLNNLGILYRKTDNYPQAEASYTKALKIRKKLAEKNPQAYLSYVAATLNNLGVLYQDTNNYPQAEASYTEALQTYRRLAATNQQAYLPYVATTLVNLSLLYLNSTPDKAKPLQYAKEAIDVLNRCNDTPDVRRRRDKANLIIDYWKEEN